MRIPLNHPFVLALLITFLAGSVTACCTNGPAPTSEGTLTVMVSIAPQKYFVERIGGDHVRVSVMVEPGANPATYEPKPEQLKSLSSAAAYFSIGVPFEDAWLTKIVAANENMMLVDTMAGIQRMPMKAHHHEEEEADHAEGAPDPHVWLSPELVKVQSRTIYGALIELDPAHEAEYGANLDAFITDIDALQTEIETTLSGLEVNKFMVFHPAWGYFARDFGLEQIPVEVGGQEPSAQEMAYLIEEAKEENIRVVFAQPEFSTQDAETIAQEIDGKVLLISPLAPDWLENMRTVARAFADVLGAEN
jgi:zinc transport system substrate-binding protein